MLKPGIDHQPDYKRDKILNVVMAALIGFLYQSDKPLLTNFLFTTAHFAWENCPDL